MHPTGHYFGIKLWTEVSATSLTLKKCGSPRGKPKYDFFILTGTASREVDKCVISTRSITTTDCVGSCVDRKEKRQSRILSMVKQDCRRICTKDVYICQQVVSPEGSGIWKGRRTWINRQSGVEGNASIAYFAKMNCWLRNRPLRRSGDRWLHRFVSNRPPYLCQDRRRDYNCLDREGSNGAPIKKCWEFKQGSILAKTVASSSNCFRKCNFKLFTPACQGLPIWGALDGINCHNRPWIA